MDRLLTADRDDRRDGELEDPSIEIIQSEEQREGRLQNEEPPWPVGQWQKVHLWVMGVPGKKERKDGVEKKSKEIMTKCPQFSEIYTFTD